MEDLSSITLQLQELLEGVDFKEKEGLIFRHISTAEEFNTPLEDFPSDLDWFNTSEPLTSTHLQGKIIVLDFFTYCCINCLHIIPHLKQLEENFSVADGLVVIGVHSAKFDNEKDSGNILLALQKYNISHPVVNDKDCRIWNKLEISCWPTILILGPSKKPLFSLVGEGHKDELLLYVQSTLKFFKNSISSHQLPIVSCNQIVTSTLLKFPGKISRWKNIFAVSDSGNHRIIIFDNDGFIKFKIGGTTAGFKDGLFETCRFNSPQGLAFYDSNEIYVADTENHAIRLINLQTLTVSTVVGNGRQGTDHEGGKLGSLQEISSPWDVCIVPSSDVEELISKPYAPFPPPPPPPAKLPLSSGYDSSPSHPPAAPPPPPSLPSGDFQQPKNISNKSNSCSKVVLIAAAGTHQIWAYFVEKSVWWKGKIYEKGVCAAVAGSGREENRNNRYPMMASFAQPSGLTYSKELQTVFIADSESSSIRKLSLKDGSVSHVVGGAKSPNNLFSYGDIDGKAYDAKLQHPLGVFWSSKENCLYICDTYNHKVKKVDIDSGLCTSLHHSREMFSEPSGGCLNESEDYLFICDTNNNCLKRFGLVDGNINIFEIKDKLETVSEKLPEKDVFRTETYLRKTGGTLTLKVQFSPKEVHGKWRMKLDESKFTTVGHLTSGKLESNVVEFKFDVRPSEVDDVLEIFFELVLCGSETCSFRKMVLKVLMKRCQTAEENVTCEVRKSLT